MRSVSGFKQERGAKRNVSVDQKQEPASERLQNGRVSSSLMEVSNGVWGVSDEFAGGGGACVGIQSL